MLIDRRGVAAFTSVVEHAAARTGAYLKNTPSPRAGGERVYLALRLKAREY
jgi:hypothetical protein